MNIIDALTCGIQFEIKSSHIYRRIFLYQKGDPETQTIWKEILGQKEKLIQNLKKALLGLQRQGPNSYRIQWVTSKEMEEGLKWIDQAEREFNSTDPNPSRIVKMIPSIVTYELQLIYSPLLNVFDLLFIKGDSQLETQLSWHIQTLNSYLIKQRAPSLTPLMKKYPFLIKIENEKKGFREEDLFQNLVKHQKPITLRLKNGTFFSGKLDGFDHFSLKCRPLNSAFNSTCTLFLKESIISVQIDD